MPVIARNDSGRIVMAHDATGEDEYRCIDCPKPAEHVRSHTRQLNDGGQTRVVAHYRYPHCGHYGDSPSHSNNSRGGDGNGGGAGGGGGGPAETEVHKRRKIQALAVAGQQFETANTDTEKYIGDKRADAVLEFPDGHEKWGRGLAIEYQHKNEGKDIEATEQRYAEHGYTTLWLWEDQYSFTSAIPEIDLFGGQVNRPWPGQAVPNPDEWETTRYNHRTQRDENWRPALKQGLATSGSEATLPPEWHDESARQIWENQDWDNLFASSRRDDAVLSETSIARGLTATLPASDGEVTVTLPPEWCDDVAQSLWAAKSIDSLHRPELWHGEHLEKFRHAESTYCATVPVSVIIGRQHLRKWWSNGQKQRETVVERLPPTYQWSGTHSPTYEHTQPEMNITLPVEYIEDHEHELRLAYQRGAGELELHVLREMREYNAPRRCAVCGEDSDYYVLHFDAISEYRCAEHMQEFAV